MRPLLALLALLLLVPAVAQADSIVYTRASDGNIWIAAADGTGAHAVTTGGNFGWPSIGDDGNVVAVNKGDGYIYVMNQFGALVRKVPSPAVADNASFPAQPPDHAQVSPDGSKIAYADDVNDTWYTYWTPSTATQLSQATQAISDYVDPSWVGSDTFLVTHQGQTLTSDQPMFGRYHTSDATTSDTFRDDGASFNATGFDAAITRAGDKIAVIEDDHSDYIDFQARNEVIRLFTGSGTFKCQIVLAHPEDPFHATPSWSPDGTKLAYAQSDGVHVVNVGTLSSTCPAEGSLVIAGGVDPYWGTPAVQAPPTPPAGGGGDTTGGGGGGGTTTGGGGGTTTTTGGGGGTDTTQQPTPSTLKLLGIAFSPKHPRARHKVRFVALASHAPDSAITVSWSFGDHRRGRGLAVKHAYKKKGRYRVAVVVTDATGARLTASKRITVRR